MTDLILDLLGRVGEKDGRVGVGAAHLGLRPLQGRDEGGVDEGRLRVPEARRHVPGHPEVRILQAHGESYGSGAVQCT